MKAHAAQLLGRIAVAARELSPGAIEELCKALERMPGDPAVRKRSALTGAVSSPGARSLVGRLAEAWEATPDVSPLNIAWGLRGAASVDDHYRREQSVEVVWTGPTPRGTTLRRMDQVLLDLIRTAERTLHLVTFAAYKVPILRDALLAAARRGVSITLIFESPDASDGKTAFAGLDALGDDLRELSGVYVWPLDRRTKDRAGRYGSLHAKFAVADEAALLVSSANLTEYALNLNMELGLLVRGGDLPALVVGHLRRLVEERVLLPI
jgi:phosphatidylserine/phosphatidylglycerophosphate/cardiolipin synthase-like enzyme